MYLEPIQSFSASPPRCPNGANPTLTTFKDPKLGINDIGFGKGINGTFKCPPAAPVKPQFKKSYSLKGTPPSKDWFYPACNAGYTKIPVFRPNPDAYGCFDPAEIAWNKKNGIVM